MRRLAVPAVPLLLSLCLSASTVGTHAYWQDSGLYLTAVKELGVLYPPGFALYVGLCRLWTLAFSFLDFTLAVHLFSSACAALAAATMAVAVRDLLKSRGPVFRVTDEDPGTIADACGILAGAVLACGFTFWSAAIYAKGYAFYYLVLSLLLWRMIRADESGRLRDFLAVAALIGLAWQAHPSASLLGGALVLFVGAHRRALGGAGVAKGAAVAAACALGPSILLLPWYLSREPWLVMGSPSGIVEALKYVTGRRFLTIPGVFGLDGIRVASFGRYLAEELLLVGSGLVLGGIAELGRRRSRLLGGLAAWMVPYATVTILFKLEGQHDCWFLAAWMPLYLVIGVGAWRLASWKREHARALLLAAGLVAVAGTLAVNRIEISQRDYVLAESFGRSILDPVDPRAVLLLWSDDANAIVSYLQRVRGDRPDVILVTGNFLAAKFGNLEYERMMCRRQADLRIPDYAEAARLFPTADPKDVAAAAFVRAHAGLARPLFLERMLPLPLMPPGYTLIPAGATWKVVPEPAPATLDTRYWTRFPVEPEDVPVGARRARGQKISVVGGSIEVTPQRYEERLRTLLVLARFHLAMAQTERGQFAHAARLCGSILDLDPEYWNNAEFVHQLAISLYAAGDRAKAERALRRSAEIGTSPSHRATARFYLGEIARARGDEAGARRWFEEALTVPGLDPATRGQIESRLKPRGGPER